MIRLTPLLPRATASLASLPARRTALPAAFNAALTCRNQQSLPTAGTQQLRQAHAISNPTLANIEKRWEAMPPQEQADLWMALRDRMKVDWNEMTMAEKKAAYWIAFGPHGPRKEAPPGEGRSIAAYTIALTLLAFAIFGVTHHFAGGRPPTLNKEWQEKTNEYLKGMKVEPITGVSSEGYTGKGQVQSPSKGKEE